MIYDIPRFGSQGVTNISPYALGFLIVMILLILFLPKRYGFVPIFLIAFLIPLSQKFVVGGLNFYLVRILVIFGLIRAGVDFLKNYANTWTGQRIKLLLLDKLFILWCASNLITFSLLWWDWGAVINRAGFLLTAGGSYFLLRFFIRGIKDVDRCIHFLIFICAILAVFMLFEQIGGRNYFEIFSGVQEQVGLSEGRNRSRGPFGHPITAGTFGATLLPLFIGLKWRGKCSILTSSIGVVSAVIITVTSVSSTPVLALLAGVGVMALWPLRLYMKLIRWSIFLSLIGLHIVMKAPVWSLISRVQVISGSSGWHRYYLMDKFINNFDEWWLLGTRSTGVWGHSMLDTANQYVDIGVTGGLITLLLFIAIIICCFRMMGTAQRLFKSDASVKKGCWVLSASLFSHVIGFIGICYFDQMVIAWNALLAMIGAASSIIKVDYVNCKSSW